MKLKNNISDYTESEFLDLINKIFAVDISENEHDDLIRYFVNITEHPRGNGVLFYPETEKEGSPEGILNIIKRWRAENGKPGFKE